MLGTKKDNEIKLYQINVTENDIHFKIRQDRYVLMQIMRQDLKTILIKINNQLRTDPRLHLRDGYYVEIEFYIFRISKVYIRKSQLNSVLTETTKKVIREFQEFREETPQNREKPISIVSPNVQPLTGVYRNGVMTNIQRRRN